MMEAMLSMKKIMESNVVVVATTSVATEVDPTHPKVEGLGSSSSTSMMEKEMITMIVDTLPVFYYEKMTTYMPSSFADLEVFLFIIITFCSFSST